MKLPVIPSGVLGASGLFLLMGCGSGERDGSDLSVAELEHIRSLGLLADGESIIYLHTNAGWGDVLTAGNFFTQRRVASYWIDEKDTTRTKVKWAWLSEVDTLIPHFQNPWPASSAIEVRTAPNTWFNVYVNGEKGDPETIAFYNGLVEQHHKVVSGQ